MVDRNFGHWLAGFVDGEGCFFIARIGQRERANECAHRPRFSLTLRCDDREVLESIVEATGVGTLHEYEPSGPGRRVARWMVQSQADCEKLVELFDKFPLHSKKARDFNVWREAVAIAADIQRGGRDNAQTYAVLADAKLRLEEVRQYA